MYPRNAATPPVIDLGEIVLKSDGTQQTTGASVRVRIGTGAWGAGAGTLACDATSGIWTYAPTQAETNADYFVVGAYKASCTSVSKTVITSNSATSGTVLLAPVTHTSAVLPNLDAAVSSRMASYTQPTGFLAATFPSTVSSYAGGAVASVTAGVTVTTNNDKTGYSLTAGTGLGNQTANITGNLSGSVGSVTAAVTLDPASINAVADQVWDEAMSGHTTAGTYGGRIVRATNSNVEVQITGSNHIAADVHEFQSGVITAGAFAANSITASALATDAVAEIQSGLALAATALSTTQWTNALATNLGTTNATVATNLNATVSSRSTQTSVDTIDDLLDTEMPALTAAVAAEAVKTSAIKAKTDNLPSDPADASDIAFSFSTVNTKLDTIDDFLDTEVAAIKAKTDNLPSDPADQSLVEAAITAATSLLATPAQVNAEVLDVLSVDTFAELSAPPAATSSLKDKITWLFMYARNKVTQTALARTLYRDDTTTVAGTSATSDNGTTFTKGEDA